MQCNHCVPHKPLVGSATGTTRSMNGCVALVLHCCREWVVLGGTGQVGNGSTDMSLADAQKIADRAIQVMRLGRFQAWIDSCGVLQPGELLVCVELC